MEVIFSRTAVDKINDAVGFYEMEYAGLGRQFKIE